MSDYRQRAAEVLYPLGLPLRMSHEHRERLVRVSVALADAYEEGRQSVGLGDFLPDPCGDEHRARASHIAETYGDWLSCTLRRGHGGEHEHEDSGVNWPVVTDVVRACERCRSEDAIPDGEHGLCAYCVHYNDGRLVL